MKKFNVTTVTGDPDLHAYKIKSIGYGEGCLQRFQAIIEHFKNNQYTIKLCSTENNDWYLVTLQEFDKKEDLYNYLKGQGVPYEAPEEEYCCMGHVKAVVSIEKTF